MIKVKFGIFKAESRIKDSEEKKFQMYIIAHAYHELPNSTSNINDTHEAYFHFENK